jgi:hypothetical protein
MYRNSHFLIDKSGYIIRSNGQSFYRRIKDCNSLISWHDDKKRSSFNTYYNFKSKILSYLKKIRQISYEEIDKAKNSVILAFQDQLLVVF